MTSVSIGSLPIRQGTEMTKVIYATALLVGLGTGNIAVAQDTPRQGSIPFKSLNGIRDFRPDGDRAIYLQARNRSWFRGEIVGPCIGLPTATRIGIDSFGSPTIDGTATLLVDGERCQLANLVESAPPTKRNK